MDPIAWMCEDEHGVRDVTLHPDTRDDWAYFGRQITPLVSLSEIERLTDALEFYAEKHRYDNSIAIDRGDGSCDYSLEILEDEGAIARAALAATNPEDRT